MAHFQIIRFLMVARKIDNMTQVHTPQFFDREIAQALAVLQVAIVSIDFKRFVYTDLDD